MGSVGLSGAETRPCQTRISLDLSRDRFCFLISTSTPEFSQGVQVSYDVALSATAFVAKVRNVRVGKQSLEIIEHKLAESCSDLFHINQDYFKSILLRQGCINR